jgi:hypothetical protein
MFSPRLTFYIMKLFVSGHVNEFGWSRRHPRYGANEPGVTWLAGGNSLWRLKVCVCSGEKTSRCCSWARPFNSRPSLLLRPSRVLSHLCSSHILSALLFILEDCLFWGRSSFAQKQHHLDQLDHSKWVDLPKLWCRFILPTILLSKRWYGDYLFEVSSQSLRFMSSDLHVALKPARCNFSQRHTILPFIQSRFVLWTSYIYTTSDSPLDDLVLVRSLICWHWFSTRLLRHTNPAHTNRSFRIFSLVSSSIFYHRPSQ